MLVAVIQHWMAIRSILFLQWDFVLTTWIITEILQTKQHSKGIFFSPRGDVWSTSKQLVSYLKWTTVAALWVWRIRGVFWWRAATQNESPTRSQFSSFQTTQTSNFIEVQARILLWSPTMCNFSIRRLHGLGSAEHGPFFNTTRVVLHEPQSVLQHKHPLVKKM